MFLVWSHTLGLLSYSTQFVSGSVPHIGTPTSFPSTHLTHQKNPGLSSTQRWAFYSPHLFSTVCFRLGPACRRGRFTVLPSPSQHSVFLVESCMQTWSFYSTSLTQSAQCVSGWVLHADVIVLQYFPHPVSTCLLYTSDAADDC